MKEYNQNPEISSLANSIMYNAVRSEFITAEEASTQEFASAAIEEADDCSDMEEIGSSDMTFIVKSFLCRAGKIAHFIDGRLELLSEVSDEDLTDEYNRFKNRDMPVHPYIKQEMVNRFPDRQLT